MQNDSIPNDAICVFKDGSSFVAVHGNFVDLQESPAGFGNTPSGAIDALHGKVATDPTTSERLLGDISNTLFAVLTELRQPSQVTPVRIVE